MDYFVVEILDGKCNSFGETSSCGKRQVGSSRLLVSASIAGTMERSSEFQVLFVGHRS